MLTSLRKTAEDRDRQKGFTLIELLVVIIIIGILAAIAIPAFLNQRTKAYDTAAKSDLKSVSTALETFYADNFAYPTKRPQVAEAGLSLSEDVSYRAFTTNAVKPGYVVFAKNAKSPDSWFISSYDGAVPKKVSAAVDPWKITPVAGTYGIPEGVELSVVIAP